LAALAVVAPLAGGSGCTSQSAPSAGQVRAVQPLEAFGMVKNDFAVIVDVREKEELAEGKVKGALWIPSREAEADSAEWKAFVAKLPKDKQIVLYCRSGRRSGIVAEKLAQQGFGAMNMGGFSAWEKAGLPVEK
jgi:rhodanese-related sulfurtransferase